ncbi:heavy-metal-associated domain-containing protein [Chitinophaga solisilvae]|uniref:Heavy-metal-associated domain-containing protein n=1 Tax=Chitinophaga solisilvae TaxID=1233460 RepID=A0A3S1CQE4_9BACT|nr:heavy-metal-associated domain-containing protein [Chitinophaga solisilvae]NSL85618.1 heavy-metal-associated domain-containing protein [Chitinophaga solisilvae]
METVQFKTNIKCSGCIATVTPGLNETAGADNWEVDLQSPDKILTISADLVDADKVKAAVEAAGYKAEKVA